VSLQDGKTTYLGVTGLRWVTSDMALYLVGGEYAFVSERANTPDTHTLAVVKTK
jgi:hypothetical protein